MLISSVSTLKLHLLVICCLFFQNTKSINLRIIDKVVCREESASRHEIKSLQAVTVIGFSFLYPYVLNFRHTLCMMRRWVIVKDCLSCLLSCYCM